MPESTNFGNIKRRVIMKGDRGGYFVNLGEGKKKYNPVAVFRKNMNGSLVKLTKKNAVPAEIKRKTRSNAGVVRKAAVSPNQGNVFRQIFKSPVMRKPRSNKGVARKVVRTPNEGDLFRQIFKTPVARKPRADKGKVRTPDQGALFRKIFKTPVMRKTKQRAPAIRRAKGRPMVSSPGGTMYKSAAAATRRKTVAAKRKVVKNLSNANPFAALFK